MIEINLDTNKIPSSRELYKYIKSVSIYGGEDIEDYTALKEYKNLKRVFIDQLHSNCSLIVLKNTLDKLQYFKTLIIENISENVNFELFGSSNNIQCLDISSGSIQNDYMHYEWYKIEHDKMFDIKMLKEWKQLRYLRLRFSKVKNLDKIKDLENIEVLELYDNCFNNLEWVSELKNLKYLCIMETSNLSTLSIKTIDELKIRLPNTKIISRYSTNDERNEYGDFWLDMLYN